VREVDLAAALVLDRLAGAEHVHAGTLEALGHLRARDHDGAAAVGDDAAVEPVQRIGDDRRVDDLLHRDDVAQQRVGIVLGVLGGGDLDPGQLRAGRAVLVHVAHGGHRVLIHHRRPERKLETASGAAAP
jgi:hypothetical protein